MPPGVRRNSMAAGAMAATIMASWPAPLAMRWTGEPAVHRALQHCGETGIARDRGLIQLLPPVDRDVRRAPISRRRSAGDPLRRGARASSAWRTSSVAAGLARDHVGRSGMHVKRPTVATSSRRGARESLHARDPAPRRRPGRRAAGASAWCRHGWPALKRHLQPALSDDGSHHAERKIRACPAPDPARCEIPDSRDIALPGRRRRCPDASRPKSRIACATVTPRASLRASRSSSRVADQGAAADERNAEADTFLFGKRRSLRWPNSGAVREALDQRDPEHHAEDAIERARMRHGIEVRADQQARRIRCRIEAAQIARRVDASRACRPLSSTRAARVHIVHRRREERPRDRARRLGELPPAPGSAR